jgi:hypothetical protein
LAWEKDKNGKKILGLDWMKLDEKHDLRGRSLEDLRLLLGEAELELLKWNNPQERSNTAYTVRGSGKVNPYRKLRKRIAFLKMLIHGKC